MKKSKKQYGLLFAIAVILYLLALSAYGYWNYTYQRSELLGHIDTRLYNCAIALKHILPDDFHDRAIDEQAISIEEDMYIVRKLAKLTEETGIKYTYSVIKKDEKLFFVATVIIGAPTKRGTYYFYEYEDADESFYTAFDRNVPTYSTVSDQWGEVRIVMIPQTSPGGIKYLACADYDIDYVKGLLQKNLIRSIATAAFLLLLGILTILIYTKLRSGYYKALQKSEEKYTQITENVETILWEYDILEDRWTYVSPQSQRLLGYAPEEWTDLSFWTEHIHEDDRQWASNYCAECTARGESHEFEYRFLKKNGEVVWLRDVLNVELNDGTPVILRGCISDITKRKQAEIEREKLLKTLATKNKELQSIVYVASHDLRSPLVNIEGFGGELSKTCMDLRQLLDEGSIDHDLKQKLLSLVDDSIPDCIKFIKAGTSKMSSLLAGLLQVSRVGTKEVEINSLDINRMMHDIRHSIEFQIQEVGTELVIEELPNCFGDGDMVNQVFSNIIGNAMKYLDPERKGKIHISGQIEHDNSIYCVEDNGIGIDPEHQDNIFELFHRLAPADTAGGEGLGLTIVTRILDRLNGSISVESEFGKGSKFFVTLPTVKA